MTPQQPNRKGRFARIDLARRMLELKALMPELLAGLALVSAVVAVVLGALGAGMPSEAEFLKRSADAVERKDFKEAVIWARKVLRTAPENRDAGMLLVRSYAGMETLGPMVAILDQLAPFDRAVHAPAHLFRAKMILAGGGDAALMKEAAAKSLDLAHEALSIHRTGDPVADQVHAMRARLFAASGDWENAHEAVSEMGATPGKEPVKMSQLQVLVAIAKDHRARRAGDFRPWLRTLVRALEMEPAGLEATAELIAGCRTWRYLPGFQENVRSAIESKGLKGFVFLLDGLDALSGGCEDEAVRRLEQGHSLIPGNPVIANNLASLIGCRISGADPKRALVLIDGVLAGHPGNADFLDTRGHILLKLERNQEAAISLEQALAAAPRADTHLALAEAYTRLGDGEKAKRHQQAALRGDTPAVPGGTSR